MADTRLVAGKYQLLRKIAQGGMAEVYLCKQTGLEGFEKLVVIKRILPHLVESADFVRMFLDEARTAADLRHPNVVQIYEIGEDQGTYFIAMEFLHGQDVRRVLRRQAEQQGRVPLAHALQTIIDAANGLDHAHKKADLHGRPLNIIHRDISPQNIIVTFDGTTKIVDFGIAKAATQSTQTQSGVLKGKYSYMSPEQASGDVIDQRTDQFALGIVLYELTTMSRLFKHQNEIMTLHAIIECEVRPPEELLPNYPPALSDIVLKALAKDRTARFKDCRALADALEEFCVEERILHSPNRLSAYMQELFKAQLADEKTLGMPVVEEASGSESIQPGTARARRNSQASQGHAPPPPAEPTRAREPEVSHADDFQSAGTLVTQSQVVAPLDALLDQPTQATLSVAISGEKSIRSLAPPPPRAVTTSNSGLSAVDLGSGGRRSLLLAGVALVIGVGLSAGGTLWWLQSSAGGRLAVRSEPEGAKVTVDGKALDVTTPLVIPDLRVGRSYALRVELPGHAPALRVVKITKTDTQEETFKLQRDGPTAVVRFKSTPPGARVQLDGKTLEGTTPIELSGVEIDQDAHAATFSLDGHADETKRFELKDGVQDVIATLKASSADENAVRLNITSTPGGATIVLSGKVLGQTPLHDVAVAGGRSHTLTAKLGGYETQERLVDAPTTGTVEVAFELEKENAPDVGWLTLDSTPGTTVYTEKGRLLGRTPFKRVKLPAGMVSLRLVNEAKGVDFTEKLRVETGKETKKTLQVPKGTLKVVVTPWAHVYVDGHKIGTTPLPGKALYVGKHELRLVNDALNKDEKEPIVIRANEDTKVKKKW